MEVERSAIEKGRSLTLLVVGGASGVGKTTVLESIPHVPRFNTGSLFKQAMTLASPDDVRKNDWSRYEEEVSITLADLVVQSFQENEAVVIDTHFGAKLSGRQYRIGLTKPLIFALGKNVLSYMKEGESKISVYVVLVSCNPHSLLRRRRLDKSRDRELIPSDCFNALRENRMYSTQYHFELLRAKQEICSHADGIVQYLVVENENLMAAQSTIKQIFKRIVDYA